MGTVLLAVSVELIPSHDCFLYGIHQTREVSGASLLCRLKYRKRIFLFFFFYRDRSSCRHGLILSHDGFLQGIPQTLAVGNLICFLCLLNKQHCCSSFAGASPAVSSFLLIACTCWFGSSRWCGLWCEHHWLDYCWGFPSRDGGASYALTQLHIYNNKFSFWAIDRLLIFGAIDYPLFFGLLPLNFWGY